ncbi:putative 3-hydroxyisobutyrate dehydrogenase, mitochondrial [Dichanthelium oligosanthes]|uniref:3-hydroxyisobutyrate dehydrogenase n=1 Tax=Dichanthelium oligosanthes TaxID=888268 RepID=A0A1E5UYQ6_9POAL|nr:putative 3-hydroxyisobutyrate dehydrogenase, mitochondrial [Dichanthelium oligosanthes]
MVGFGWRVGSKVQRWGRSCLRGFSSAAIPSQLEVLNRLSSHLVVSLPASMMPRLGNMGSHMVRNLITAGYKVTVHDINENSMKKFSDDGIPTKQSPLEVSESSDVVITMLPSSSHVLEVYNGTKGLLGGGGRLGPWLYIDSSTVDPQTSRKISMAISRCHLKENKGYAENPMILDAPVSGGVPAAEAGKLTFMIKLGSWIASFCRLKIWIWPWPLHLESASNVPWALRHLKFTESYAGMAANSRTSHAHSAITMLARMKSDLVTLANLAP